MILKFFFNKWVYVLDAISIKIYLPFGLVKQSIIIVNNVIQNIYSSWKIWWLFKTIYVDKGEKQTVVCECGKTITKPYWYKNHLSTVYHNKHSYR